MQLDRPGEMKTGIKQNLLRQGGYGWDQCHLVLGVILVVGECLPFGEHIGAPTVFNCALTRGP